MNVSGLKLYASEYKRKRAEETDRAESEPENKFNSQLYVFEAIVMKIDLFRLKPY